MTQAADDLRKYMAEEGWDHGIALLNEALVEAVAPYREALRELLTHAETEDLIALEGRALASWEDGEPPAIVKAHSLLKEDQVAVAEPER